jgi:NAD(P)-dependent dehydrogenase (short-subunit alcohol dehydrogenase family)
VRTAELTDDEFDRVFAVNSAGTFNANRAVLGRMGAPGYGRVVNIASVAGKDGSGSAA